MFIYVYVLLKPPNQLSNSTQKEAEKKQEVVRFIGYSRNFQITCKVAYLLYFVDKTSA